MVTILKWQKKNTKLLVDEGYYQEPLRHLNKACHRACHLWATLDDWKSFLDPMKNNILPQQRILESGKNYWVNFNFNTTFLVWVIISLDIWTRLMLSLSKDLKLIPTTFESNLKALKRIFEGKTRFSDLYEIWFFQVYLNNDNL